MRITLDHNCLIDLEKDTNEGQALRNIISSTKHECFVVNIGASELREKGIRPDRYHLFDKFINDLGLGEIKRLDPMALIDITFIDHCLISSKKMIELSNKIHSILFPSEIEKDSVIESPPFQPIGRKFLNRLCDTHSMWCHIHYGDEIFLTSDMNFHKNTKKQKLIDLGVGEIKKPSEIKS